MVLKSVDCPEDFQRCEGSLCFHAESFKQSVCHPGGSLILLRIIGKRGPGGAEEASALESLRLRSETFYLKGVCPCLRGGVNFLRFQWFGWALTWSDCCSWE